MWSRRLRHPGEPSSPSAGRYTWLVREMAGPVNSADEARTNALERRRSARAEAKRQASRHAEERGAPLDRRGRELEIAEPPDDAADRDLRLEAGEVRAQAEMGTTTEGQGLVWLPLDVESVGVRKHLRVAVGGGG